MSGEAKAGKCLWALVIKMSLQHFQESFPVSLQAEHRSECGKGGPSVDFITWKQQV